MRSIFFIRSLLLFIILLLSVFSAQAQRPDNKQDVDYELALQYLQQEQYEQAIHYLEKLYGQNPQNRYYEPLFHAYLAIEEPKKAERLAKKQSRNFPENPLYLFDLGYLYTVTGERDEAEKQFDKAIDEAADNQREVIDLANKFININELEYAEKIYLKGKRKIKDYPFNFELAQVYFQKQNYQAMIEEYLNLLEINEGYAQSIQNALQTALDPDPENKMKDLLRTELLRRIQKNPNATIYSEMLIWLYVQEQDFAGALIQAKALDKRNNESGNRIMALAQLARSNKKYDVAIECYEYIIAKGRDGFRYLPAKQQLVEVFNEKIVNSIYSRNDLLQLEDLYRSTLNELGESHQTIGLMKGMGHLQAFYLDKSDSAILLLKKALQIPQVSPEETALCKLELGDVYLVSDEIWEASLLYAQVEKAFKYDRIGEIAKFKNARVFYYSGDFKWAKAQLDVLKGSTSKLIANDAMELSLLISDNITIDTLRLPLLKFAHSDLLILQNKLDEAFLLLDSIEYLFPSHALHDEILFRKYEIYYKKQDYQKAAEQLRKVYEYDPRDILADNALFLLARLNEEQLQNKEKAMELYKNLMTDHSNSIYVTEARKRFRELRGDSIN